MRPGICHVIGAFLQLFTVRIAYGAILPQTSIWLKDVVFSSKKTFKDCFPDSPSQDVDLNLDCQISTLKNFIVGSSSPGTTKGVTVNDNSSEFNNFYFAIDNPSDGYTVTCKVTLSQYKGNSTSGFIVLFQDDATNQPGAPLVLLKVKFSQPHPEWYLNATLTRTCIGNAFGFNCDRDTADQTTGAPGGSTPLGASDATEPPTDETKSNKEDLYFWLMIGMAALALVILIALVVFIIVFCCCCRKPAASDRNFGTISYPIPEATIQRAPVYLHTPPRDARHGYLGPPPVVDTSETVRADASQRSPDDEWDSIADEWTEPTPRREAQV